MREIKFRVFTKEDGLCDVIEIDFDNKNVEYILNDFDDSASVKFNKCKLLQCTGLKDKNDVYIYRGDIVLADSRGHNENGLHYIIEYNNTNACFFGNIDNLVHNKHRAANHNKPLCDIRQNIEVIGNIYENKELLDER